MGHFYDEKHVRAHAIKSMNPNLKAVVTGCYATTSATRVAGYILSAAATLPFAPCTLPLAVAVGMVATTVILGLGISHLRSRRAFAKEEAIREEIIQLANRHGVEADSGSIEDDDPNLILLKLLNKLKGGTKTKIRVFELYNRKYIASVPLKFQAAWRANHVRNSTGYITCGAGTVFATIATVALRIFGL